MDRILSRFIFFLLYVFSSFFLSFSLLSQIFISSFPLRISSPLSYSVVQGVVSSLFIPSSFFPFFSGLLLSGGARRCGRNWFGVWVQELREEESWRGRPSLWNLPPYASSQLIATTTTTEALILTTTFHSNTHFTTTKVTSLFSLCI